MVLAALHENDEWNAALDRRGIIDRSLVQIDPWPAGTFGLDHEEGRRISRCLSYLRESKEDNGYARPARGPDRLRRHGAGRGARGRRPRRRALPAQVAAATSPRTTDRSGPISSRSRSPSRRDRASRSRATWSAGRSGRCGSAWTRSRAWCLRSVGLRGRRPVRPILHRAVGQRDGRALRRSGPDARWKNAFDAGEWGLGRMANSLDARLRLPRRDPLLRRRLGRRAGKPGHRQERHLHPRGGLRDPLEARRHGVAGAPRCAGRAGWWSARSPPSATTSTASTGTSTSTAPCSSRSS